MSSLVPRFDAERARAASMRTRYREIRGALEELHVRAESNDRSVSVEMGAGGVVLAINLSDQALRRSPQALAQLLLETINSGMRQVADLTNEVVSPYVSGSNLNVQAITSGRLPAIADEQPKSAHALEIEQASAIPKRPLGSRPRPPVRYSNEEDGRE